MPKYICINIYKTFFSIWQHVKTLPSHKIAVLVLSRWIHSKKHVFKKLFTTDSLDSHSKT